MKEKAGDAVLFFRLGDFYEMFERDAIEVSSLLNLTLTHRQGRPMCGIPHHAARSYIARLLKYGKKIAICEQLGEAGKGLVERDIVEVVTPGTVVEDEYLDKERNNYVLCVSSWKGRLSVAYMDVSSGEFNAYAAAPDSAGELVRREIARLAPREVIVQESLYESDALAEAFDEKAGLLVNRYPDWAFDPRSAEQRLSARFGTNSLKGFGFDEGDPALASAGALFEYAVDASKTSLPQLRDLHKWDSGDSLVLDEATQRNLELFRNLQDGSPRYTLIETIDETRTSMGARALRRWLASPLNDLDAIRRRLDGVESLYRDQERLARARQLLGSVYDLERLAAKAAMRRLRPKDMLAIRASLESLRGLVGLSGDVPSLPALSETTLAELEGLVSLVARAVEEETASTDAGCIRKGFDPELDRLRSIREDSDRLLEEYAREEREKTGIPGLKIKYNRMIGYFIEVARTQCANVPAYFNRRQSMSNGERFTTERLVDFESELLTAGERVTELERRLYAALLDDVFAGTKGLFAAAAWLSHLDALASQAFVATTRGYARPAMFDDSRLSIVEGRHPVVEVHVRDGAFVPNSLELERDARRFALITGPNMAGKSTYLRQTALIVLMAHAGMFVPAQSAEIGLVDRIFCRVGAQDNLARGESTFLVEMHETAQILRNATDRSLVIMDEVGRGTSTVDGLSIARAVCEHLLDGIRSRTLFATHYLELADLEHPGFQNLSMQVVDDGSSIVFLKRVAEGPAAGSYGIHVAALAGVPSCVCERAEELRIAQRVAVVAREGRVRASDPPPERAPKPVASPKGPRQGDFFDPGELVLSELASLDVERMTPVEALNRLSVFQKVLRDAAGKA